MSQADPSIRSDQTHDVGRWHPLELIPYFRHRWQPGLVRDLIYTFVWNNLFGVCFFITTQTFAPTPNISRPSVFLHLIWAQFVVTQTVGYSIHTLLEIGDRLGGRWIRATQPWIRSLYFMIVPVLGLYIGYWIGFGLLDLQATRAYVFSSKGAWSITLFALMLAAILAVAFYSHQRQAETEAELSAERQRTLDAERRALESQLRMLQAQIEPHFLYNTLANAVGLIGPAPDKARLLLERLIEYLRASLTASREANTELGREFATLGAYLDLMQVRMGHRLTFQIELPAELHSITLPPMLLQPLVENAIQHGLEPKIEGGEIRISARRDHDMLEISVADSGIGIQPKRSHRTGSGVGLSNLRERLSTLYEGKASLSLLENTPSGLRVTLRLPLASAPLRQPIPDTTSPSPAIPLSNT
ncbi:sensor histidine kinase [Chitinimonas sp.]|uniref:sensor histidine kinase n=1 Tax=Chitinimonas sp. TaxID=1934313 RepID=UPI0035B0C65A